MSEINYLKYYWLEKDFFPEIYKYFHEKRILTPEQFFSIIIWKSIRPRKRIKQGLLASGKSLNDAIKDLAVEIYNVNVKEKEQKLEIMLKRSGFQLAMASAILTVLYPDIFTVYDIRVRGQLRDPKNSKQIYPDITYTKNRIRRYFDEYIPQVLQRGRQISKNPNLSLRDCDRLLWAKSWHEDLKEFFLNK